jgi:hypothetical protein
MRFGRISSRDKEDLAMELKKDEITIESLFKDYDGELPYQSDELDWGPDVGSEIIE